MNVIVHRLIDSGLDYSNGSKDVERQVDLRVRGASHRTWSLQAMEVKGEVKNVGQAFSQRN